MKLSLLANMCFKPLQIWWYHSVTWCFTPAIYHPHPYPYHWFILSPGASPQAACSVGEHGATRTPPPQHRAPDHYDDDGGDDDDDDDNDDNNCDDDNDDNNCDDDNDDNMVMVHQEWGSICESRWKFSSLTRNLNHFEFWNLFLCSHCVCGGRLSQPSSLT